MAGAQTSTELHFWQRSRQWSKAIFQLTKREQFSDDRRLVEQINDSSESVGANIAEGFGRGTQGEFVQFLGYSNGSLNETQSHLCAAYDREFITKDEFGRLFQEGTEIRKMNDRIHHVDGSRGRASNTCIRPSVGRRSVGNGTSGLPDDSVPRCFSRWAMRTGTSKLCRVPPRFGYRTATWKRNAARCRAKYRQRRILSTEYSVLGTSPCPGGGYDRLAATPRELAPPTENMPDSRLAVT